MFDPVDKSNTTFKKGAIAILFSVDDFSKRGESENPEKLLEEGFAINEFFEDLKWETNSLDAINVLEI